MPMTDCSLMGVKETRRQRLGEISATKKTSNIKKTRGELIRCGHCKAYVFELKPIFKVKENSLETIDHFEMILSVVPHQLFTSFLQIKEKRKSLPESQADVQPIAAVSLDITSVCPSRGCWELSDLLNWRDELVPHVVTRMFG